MANEDLKAILDERKVEYRKGINRKQLEKLIADTAPTDDDAPLVGEDTPEADTPQTDVQPTPEDDAPALPRLDKKKAQDIERVQSNGSWHCPLCDHANHVAQTEKCLGCGAVRKGDTLTPLVPLGDPDA